MPSALKDTQQLSVLEKIGYSLGDFSANLIFQTLVSFLAFYYTDVFGIPARDAEAVIFVGGLLGAFVFTPLMGFVADRTRTRWGRFRPWILWTAIPFGALSLLAFSTPALGPEGKVVYACTTYILLVAVYVANNLPYAALSGVLTGNMAERNSMSSYRFGAVMLAQFVIQVLLLPLVLILGHGDKAVGFSNAMALFACVGTLFFLITFFTTKERVLPEAAQPSSIRQDLADLAANRPWQLMLGLTFLVFVTLALKGGMYVYYFKYYMDGGELARFLDGSGFNHCIAGLNSLLTGMGLSEFQWPKDAPTSALSLFNAASIACGIVGILLSKRLADRFGKRDVFGAALFSSTLFLLAFALLPAHAVGAVIVANMLHGFFYGITVPLLWSMVADVADFSEWKTRRRATAIVFSAILCGLKAGLTIGGGVGAGILNAYHYDAGAAMQSVDAVRGIKLAVSVYSSIPLLLAVALLFFYEIDRRTEARIEQDLAARRGGA
ncbi:MAG: glycoside-pentoside-hexuronide (GPH):cation symporter [Pseudomonadota bacterium]